MLAETLQRIIDGKLATAREIGELTGVAPSTVYRWIRGESQPDFDAIRMLVRHLKSREAVVALLAAFASGTGWRFHNVDSELDVNKDNVIDAADALDSSINAVRSATHTLVEVREALRDGRIDPNVAVELIASTDEVIRHCTIAQHVIVEMAEQRKRKKIKPR